MIKKDIVPILSSNIEIHSISENEYLIHEITLDHRVKIKKTAYDFIQMIDGIKTIEKISDECKIDVDFIYSFLFEKLGRYGIINSEYTKNKITILPNSKPSYLKLSFIFIPARVVSLVTPYLKSLFSDRVYKVLITLSILFVGYSLITNFNEIINYSITEKDLLIFFLLGFLSATFHEFGHVTATEFFGAKQNGIGGGFYIFTPVYFADVSDIWKLSTKKRVIVNLSGVYFELLMCSLYIVIGICFNNKFISLIGSVIFIKALYNLLPFLRSDGYWILTDLLNIPTLYKSSQETLKKIITNLFNRKMKYSKKELFLAFYGLLNYLLLFMFIVYVAFYQIRDIVYFPVNFFNYIVALISKNATLTINEVSVFFIPFLFYYLLFSILKGYFVKLKIKNKINVQNRQN